MGGEMIVVFCFAGFNVMTGVAGYRKLVRIERRRGAYGTMLSKSRMSVGLGVCVGVIVAAFYALVVSGDESGSGWSVDRIVVWLMLVLTAAWNAWAHFLAWLPSAR